MERDEGVGDKDENDWEKRSGESDRMRKREREELANWPEDDKWSALCDKGFRLLSLHK